MIWFFIIVGLLIFAPMLLAGLLGIVIVFIVFFGVWGLTAYAVLQVAPDNDLIAISIGFIVGIVAARWLFKKALEDRINISR